MTKNNNFQIALIILTIVFIARISPIIALLTTVLAFKAGYFQSLQKKLFKI